MRTNILWAVLSVVVIAGCGPIGSVKSFKIDSRFSDSEKEQILDGASLWNDMSNRLTSGGDVLIYDGEFSNPNGLDDSDLTEGKGLVIYSKRNEPLWRMAQESVGGKVVVNGYCYGRNIALGMPQWGDCQFAMIAAHEFGHLLGMPGHVPGRGHLMSQSCNDYSGVTPEDERAFCSLFDCSR